MDKQIGGPANTRNTRRIQRKETYTSLRETDRQTQAGGAGLREGELPSFTRQHFCLIVIRADKKPLPSEVGGGDPPIMTPHLFICSSSLLFAYLPVYLLICLIICLRVYSVTGRKTTTRWLRSNGRAHFVKL